MLILNAEDFKKAKKAKTAEELITLAKENGAEITLKQAKTIFAQLNSKSNEISDDELDNVAGGNAVANQVNNKATNCWLMDPITGSVRFF